MQIFYLLALVSAGQKIFFRNLGGSLIVNPHITVNSRIIFGIHFVTHHSAIGDYIVDAAFGGVSFVGIDLGRGNLSDSAYMGSVTEDYQCS